MFWSGWFIYFTINKTLRRVLLQKKILISCMNFTLQFISVLILAPHPVQFCAIKLSDFVQAGTLRKKLASAATAAYLSALGSMHVDTKMSTLCWSAIAFLAFVLTNGSIGARKSSLHSNLLSKNLAAFSAPKNLFKCLLVVSWCTAVLIWFWIPVSEAFYTMI